jgi:tetratricopeptide (TPR) repeat protein
LSSPPTVSYNSADLILLKSYRTLRNLLEALRPLNKIYSDATHGQQNLTSWYSFLQLTGMMGEFLCSIPSQREKKLLSSSSSSSSSSSLLLTEVHDLYLEILSFPFPLVSASPLSTRSNQLKSFSLLQYYQLLLLKKQQQHLRHLPQHHQVQQDQEQEQEQQMIQNLHLEFEIEFYIFESYEIYVQLSKRYGSQGLWMIEGMIGIISCEIRKYQQAEIYFSKAMMTMSRLGEDDFSYGILLKYYSECLLKMKRYEESEVMLKRSLLIHHHNEIPLSHVTYQHLYEIRQGLLIAARQQQGQGQIKKEERQQGVQEIEVK